MEHFPIEINRADYNTLLRIPGIGVKSAYRIIAARKFTRLDFDNLKKMGIVLKRARHFITCNGKFYGLKSMDPLGIRGQIVNPFKNGRDTRQISMFDEVALEDKLMEIGGQI